MATDSVSGNASIALVTIHLRDINDHRPTFPYSFYSLSIWEHSADGTVVTDNIHVSEGDPVGLGSVRHRETHTWGP